MSSQLIQCVPAHQDQMKDLKDDRMVADTTNGATVVVVVVDMKAPPGRDRHHHEEGLEDAVVGGGAEDIIDAERQRGNGNIGKCIILSNNYEK